MTCVLCALVVMGNKKKTSTSDEILDAVYSLDVRVNERTIKTQSKLEYTLKMLKDGIRLLLKGEEQVLLDIGSFSYHHNGTPYDLKLTHSVDDVLRIVERVTGTDPYLNQGVSLPLMANNVSVTLSAPSGPIPVTFEMINGQITVSKLQNPEHLIRFALYWAA